ncbi:MAG: hypothetical protein GY841_18095 [FCB group bacterium]|nr:hypothetical protein [FCB group bacterium]
MPNCEIGNIAWYEDGNSISAGEPGIYHSYMASLATVLNSLDDRFDPIWMMGSGAFAFRTFVNETFCPSAMSIFDWKGILPEAVEQAGYQCRYISRMWDEKNLEKERREQAETAIIDSIDRGIGAVVWDVHDCEWGVIIGYDTDKKQYITLTNSGKRSNLPFQKLGKNGIDILSVAIPVERNDRSRTDIINKSLKAALAHGEGKEWTDRPKYQNGLAAYDLWSTLFERWGLIVQAGNEKNLPKDIPQFSTYYAGHCYSARCYARDYLRMISKENKALDPAIDSYTKVAELLKPVWDFFSLGNSPDLAVLQKFAQDIKQAGEMEKEGLDHIRAYLEEV